MEFYSILKAVSMVATGVFGVIGVLTNYKEDDGRITRWGKIAIAGILLSATLSLALYGLESVKTTKEAAEAKHQYEETKRKLDTALEASNRLMSLQRTSLNKSQALEDGLKSTSQSLKRINTASREMLEEQATLLEAQRLAETHLQLGQLRSTLPLEPLTVYFEKETSMDDPEVAAFIRGLKKTRLITSMSKIFIAQSKLGIDPFYNNLVSLQTQFVFTKQEEGRKSSVAFSCMPELYKGLENNFLVNLPPKAEPFERVDLVADFSRNILTQKVICRNLIRSGNDVASTSSLDLVGRRMTWGLFPEYVKFDGSRFGGESLHPKADPHPDTGITKIALVFPYDYRAESEARYIVIHKNVTNITITADSIGLGGNPAF